MESMFLQIDENGGLGMRKDPFAITERQEGAMQIESNCCCFGLGSEIHVLEKDCPIKRKEGRRKYENNGEQIIDCTCIYTSIFPDGSSVPKCQFYDGVEFDKASNKYLVNCTFK